MKHIVAIILNLFCATCASGAALCGPITFYAYPAHLAGLPGIDRRPDEAEEARIRRAIEQQLIEIREHLGASTSRGRIGIALNYPYTVFVEGEGAGSFSHPCLYRPSV